MLSAARQLATQDWPLASLPPQHPSDTGSTTDLSMVWAHPIITYHIPCWGQHTSLWLHSSLCMEILVFILPLGLVFFYFFYVRTEDEFILFICPLSYRMGCFLFCDIGYSIKHKENGQTQFLS